MNDKTEEQNEMVTPITWDEFRESGMLWWINRLLHTFGLAIVVELDEDGKVDNVYPARVKFRGFVWESEETGFKKVSRFMTDNADKLKEEADE